MMVDEFKRPGLLIEHLLTERGWTQAVLAVVMGISQATVSKLVSGARPVDAETALVLGEIFEIAPERFLDLQAAYDLAKARIVASPDPARVTRAQIYSSLPVAEMAKRGWLRVDDITNVAAVEAQLRDFFGVQSLDEIEFLPHAAKKTNVTGDATPTQLAWLYRVRRIARGLVVPHRYSPASVRTAVEALGALRISPEAVRHVPRILFEAGIRFVIVESLARAKIDGVCTWLDDFKPVIGITTRFDRIDNFWFVLRHEVEHVLRGHGRVAAMLDAELEGERAGSGDAIPEDERVANDAAAEFCVPRESLDRFVARKAPLFVDRDIIGFARTIQRHPGLVAGQLQYRTGRYDRWKQHLVKVRSLIAPSAIVDGWGDVAPVSR